MKKFAKKAYRKILSIAFNNPFINWILIFLSLDYITKYLLHRNNWEHQTYKEEQSLEENVGYSSIPHIQNLLNIAKTRLVNFADTHLKPADAILEVGCGTGVILKALEPCGYYLYGIDLNRAFLTKAEKILPAAHLFQGNYLNGFIAPKKYKLIFCYSVLVYIEPSKIEKFFDKVYEDLLPGGYVFIQYHHAVKFTDLLYSDLTYTRYSPHRLEKIVSQKFNILASEQFYDGRKVGWYDAKHYYFPDGTNERLDTIENTSLLIIQKKSGA